MNEELVEKLVIAQLKLTEKFNEILDLVKLDLQSNIAKAMCAEIQRKQAFDIHSVLQCRGDK